MQQYKIVEKIHDHPLIREVLESFYFDIIDFRARCIKYQNRGEFGECWSFFWFSGRLVANCRGPLSSSGLSSYEVWLNLITGEWPSFGL
jgi:hypothetical protein